MVLNVATYSETEIIFWLRIWKWYYVAVVQSPEADSIDRTISFGYWR